MGCPFVGMGVSILLLSPHPHAPNQSTDLGSSGHLVLFRVNHRRRGYGISLLDYGKPLRSCISVVPQIDNLEMLLCEVVNVKPGLLCKPKDVRDARVIGYLLSIADNRQCNQSKKNRCAAKSILLPSQKKLDIWSVPWHRRWRCRVSSLPTLFSVLIWSSIPSLYTNWDLTRENWFFFCKRLSITYKFSRVGTCAQVLLLLRFLSGFNLSRSMQGVGCVGKDWEEQGK